MPFTVSKCRHLTSSFASVAPDRAPRTLLSVLLCLHPPQHVITRPRLHAQLFVCREDGETWTDWLRQIPQGGHLSLITTKLSLMGLCCYCTYLLKGRWWTRWPLGDVLPRGIVADSLVHLYFLHERIQWVSLCRQGRWHFYTLKTRLSKTLTRFLWLDACVFITANVDLFTARRWIGESTRVPRS